MFRNFIVLFFIILFGVTSLFAQELSEKQRSVADRYAQLEQVLLRMSEASAASNPRRSVLLKKVLLAGKEKLLALRLKNIVDTLDRRQFTEAANGQETIEKDLLELLQLLESENREQRRMAEKEKIKEFLRNLEEIIHQEKNLKSKTAQNENENLSPLEKEQKNIRLQTQTLRNQITENEHPDVAASDNNQPLKDESESNESDKSNNQDEKNQDKKIQNENEHDSQQSENKLPQELSENDNKNGNENKNEDNNENNTDNIEQSAESPTQQAMQQALRRMNQAEKKLQKAEKNGAMEAQEEAIAELQRVKAELEKILRQLREEELLQTLEKLEARFKRMLRIEQSIRSQTEKVSVEAKNAVESALRPIRIRANQIGADQQSVIEDADAIMVLLREDGTAQAMVESLLQARFDMTEVKSRLDRTTLDSVTLDIEDAVIGMLQEMLDAVELAIKEAEKRKEQQQQQQQSSNGNDNNNSEEPLIQLLSELKIIRSMQQRVNERTERYEKLIGQLRNEPNADYSTLRKNVEELARQQNRISRILHDLKIGKTK
jgi:hypothetical protein